MPSLPYVLLGAAIISMWLPGRASRAWLPLLGVSLVGAVVGQEVTWTGLTYLGLLTVCLYATERWLVRNRETWGLEAMALARGGAFAGAVVLAVGIGTGVIPGCSRLVIYKGVVLSPGAFPYTLALNFGIAVIGLLIIGLGRHKAPAAREWGALLRRTLPYAAATVAAVIVVAMLIGYTRPAPKWPPMLGLWLAANLLFTCVAEEAFFRGFIQRHLTDWLSKLKGGTLIAWLVASVAFGVAHVAGGGGYVLLATIAGLGYGLVYMKTARLEAAIVTHFALDTVHMLLFAYPRLAV